MQHIHTEFKEYKDNRDYRESKEYRENRDYRENKEYRDKEYKKRRHHENRSRSRSRDKKRREERNKERKEERNKERRKEERDKERREQKDKKRKEEREQKEEKRWIEKEKDPLKKVQKQDFKHGDPKPRVTPTPVTDPLTTYAPKMIEVVCNDRMGKRLRVKCCPQDSIGDLKKLLSAHAGTRPDKIRLQKSYTVYKDHISIQDYEIQDGMGVEMYYN